MSFKISTVISPPAIDISLQFSRGECDFCAKPDTAPIAGFRSE
jgi:hypothetical protein